MKLSAILPFANLVASKENFYQIQYDIFKAAVTFAIKSIGYTLTTHRWKYVGDKNFAPIFSKCRKRKVTSIALGREKHPIFRKRHLSVTFVENYWKHVNDGNKVIRFKSITETEIELLSVFNEIDTIDVWSHEDFGLIKPGMQVDMRLSRTLYSIVQNQFGRNSFDVLIEDYQVNIIGFHRLKCEIISLNQCIFYFRGMSHQLCLNERFILWENSKIHSKICILPKK